MRKYRYGVAVAAAVLVTSTAGEAAGEVAAEQAVTEVALQAPSAALENAIDPTGVGGRAVLLPAISP